MPTAFWKSLIFDMKTGNTASLKFTHGTLRVDGIAKTRIGIGGKPLP